MRCTEVAGRPFPDGDFTCRDIGDGGRSSTEFSLPNYAAVLSHKAIYPCDRSF